MTSTQNEFIVKRLRFSATLVVLGLFVEALTLAWNHPLSFIAFVGIGGLLMFVGIVVFLLALVSSKAGQT